MSFVPITPYASRPIGPGPAQTGGSGDINVLIADDRRAASDSIWALLNGKEGIDLIATVQSGEQALRVARERKPCVCLVSATLLARDGLELACQIKHLSDPPRVLIYADSVDERLIGSAIIAEADGVLWCSQDPEETAAAIRRVACGQQNFPTLVRDGFDQLAVSVDDRDRAIVAMLLDKAHPDDIARTLGLSARSLRERRQIIVKRLKLSDDLQRPPEPTFCSTRPSASARSPQANNGHRATATRSNTWTTTVSGDTAGRQIRGGRLRGFAKGGRPQGRPIVKRAVDP